MVRQHIRIDLACIVHLDLKTGCRSCIEYCIGLLIIFDFLDHYASPPACILCYTHLFICPTTRVTYPPQRINEHYGGRRSQATYLYRQPIVRP